MSTSSATVVISDSVKKKDFIIPDPNWSRDDWLRCYHINNVVRENFADFISSRVQQRFCGCILSEREAQKLLQMFPNLRVHYKSLTTYGPKDQNCRVICQSYTVDRDTGKLTKAEMGSEPRYSFIFNKFTPRNTGY